MAGKDTKTEKENSSVIGPKAIASGGVDRRRPPQLAAVALNIDERADGDHIGWWDGPSVGASRGRLWSRYGEATAPKPRTSAHGLLCGGLRPVQRHPARVRNDGKFWPTVFKCKWVVPVVMDPVDR